MTIDLTGDDIGLIQECLYVRIANLKQFERDYENQQEIQDCEKLLDRTYKWQEIFEQNEE
jgi:hypothetical protein